MSKMQEQLNYVFELQSLRQRIDELETQFKKAAESAAESPRVFEVVLRVETRASSWGDNHVDACEVEDLFYSYKREMKSALNLTDEGDEIKVVKVTEVT
jgi:hypothetical protein